jgi:hypothetical protein
MTGLTMDLAGDEGRCSDVSGRRPNWLGIDAELSLCSHCIECREWGLHVAHDIIWVLALK